MLVKLISIFLLYVPYVGRMDKVRKYMALWMISAAGFRKPVFHDLRKHKHDSSIIAFQHNSYIDGYILMSVLGSISFMVHAKYTTLPLIKPFIESFGFVVMDPTKKGNSSQITEFIKSNPEKLLGIAPAGGKAPFDNKIGEFSSGAFVPMQPVTPALIRYKNEKGSWFKPDGSYKNEMEYVKSILDFSRHEVEVTLLEEVTAADCKTPREFADKVARIMREYDAAVPAFSAYATIGYGSAGCD